MDIEEVRKHTKTVAVGFSRYIVDSKLVLADPKKDQKRATKIYHPKYDEWLSMEQLFDKYIKELISGDTDE